MADAYDRCERILNDNRDKLEAVASYLLEHETMEREAFSGRVRRTAVVPEKRRGLRKGRRPGEPDGGLLQKAGNKAAATLQNCWSDGKMHQRSHWSLAKLPIRLSLYRGQMTAFFSAIF